MLLALIVFLLMDFVALATLLAMIRQAPYGWEDETGWHRGFREIPQTADDEL